MTSIAKGDNLAVEASVVRAVLSWDGGPFDIDVSALLLGESGQVASDANFVFYNQPEDPSRSVRHQGKQHDADARRVTDSLHIDLQALPVDVDRVVLAASADGGTFGQVPSLLLQLLDAAADAAPIADFALDADTETAMVTGELYRRNGQWKFRAVGQGYADGLAGLAGDFGISVDDDAVSSGPAPDSVLPESSTPLGRAGDTLPPLPPYDGPRPVPGQIYSPAPEGFAPPPPR